MKDYHSKVENEFAMLEGNLNRLCITTDVRELLEMRDWAKRRIERILELRISWLMQTNEPTMNKR